MGLGRQIKDFFENMNLQLINVDKHVNSITKNIEKRIQWQIRKIKKEVTALVLLAIFLLLTFVFIAIGLVFFFARFFPLDYVLLVFGAIFALIAILIKAVT